ncbi:hypothetical protein N431DRAFT_465919 [Stipitochalara longipes BDJ]|nr:hypothetical protein N431DRAFT_465919 [Stipitochalara longipes BDJ]
MVTRKDFLYRPSTTTKYFVAKDVLQPLQLLRNIPCLKLDEARGRDLPIYDTSLQASILVYNNIPLNLKTEIKALVEGDSPVAHVFKMYTRLVNYAEAFERNTKFREAMRWSWNEARQRLPAEYADSYLEGIPFRGNPYK